jgi:hypothetical protein
MQLLLEPDLKRSKTPPFVYPEDRGPPPASSVSLYELGFGTVAGVCAGVFVKKGAKAVAWFLGGIFVLLQVHPISSCSARGIALTEILTLLTSTSAPHLWSA